MAGLQRSSETFRRSGSSGLVWEDRFLQDELKQPKKAEEGSPGELRHSRSVGSAGGTLDRSLSNGGQHGYRAGRVSPALDPPSPKLAGGCCFGIFAKPEPANKAKRGGGRRR